jgi:hypothetical protein
MNRLDGEKRTQVISCLISGCSIRSTVRMTGVAKKTVMRVLVEVGDICADYQDRVFRNLHARRLQLDEMWAWIYCKEKNRTEAIAKAHPDSGDVWLWVAVDADTKLVPSWMLGQRDTVTATAFVSDLASRLSNRVQITTDGHRPYLEAVENALEWKWIIRYCRKSRVQCWKTTRAIHQQSASALTCATSAGIPIPSTSALRT